MKLHFILLLAIISWNPQTVTACDDCQDTSDCGDCTESSDCNECCESSGCTTNCRPVNTCFAICQRRCRTTNCKATCRRKCCPSCDNGTTSITPTTSGPPTPEPRTPASNTSNKMDSNIVSTFHITNVVNTENRIHVPVNINNENFQSVQIISSHNSSAACEKDCDGNSTHPPPIPPSPCNETTCRPEVKYIKVPVPVPVPFPVKVPIYIKVPIPRPPPDCCVVVAPCITQICEPYRHVCGQGCTGSYFYDQRNPCEGGCHRRSGFNSRSCDGYGQCLDRYMDCGQCSEDSFSTFRGYQKCGGCFYR